MSTDGILRSVAEALGIGQGYHDIWGNWHPLSSATARALVQAMGINADHEPALQQAHAALTERSWRRLAPPVAVVRDGESPGVALAIDADPDHALLHWQVRCEDGQVRAGESCITALTVMDGRELDGRRISRRRLPLPDNLPLGYHQLILELQGQRTTATIVRAPARCHEAGQERRWGVSVQLYALRSGRNWGMGDFGDLLIAIRALAPLGASFIGLNPLHALYPAAPHKSSPYSPSSRLYLNPLYLDVEAIADFAQCEAARETVQQPAFQSQLADLRDCELVDHAGVARSKLPVLELLFDSFHATHLGTGSERDRAFEAFRDAGGASLRAHALFDTLSEQLAPDGPDTWPRQYTDASGPAVAAFAHDHAARVLYFQYLQWQCAEQLAGCRDAARQQGMYVGLYLDLAVGSDAGGSEVWAGADDYARGVSIGAPPDDFAPQGQVWGLPPWRPGSLSDSAYAPFIRCLRSGMQHAGAIRIDHVLGLLRLFWVPDGGNAGDGAYVDYPVRDLLAIVALESVRARCLVVGEDLGTVPDAMRAALAEFGVLSYRVFYFEKHWHGDHSFRAPHEYPREALCTLSTHDLPTLAGYWTGRDLELRNRLDLFPSPGFESEQRQVREHDRWRILQALEREGLRPAQPEPPGETPPSPELVEAVHRFLARGASTLLSIQLEDLLGVMDQANVPGTVTEQPNWRRKLPLAVEDFAHHPALRATARAIDAERQGQR